MEQCTAYFLVAEQRHHCFQNKPESLVALFVGIQGHNTVEQILETGNNLQPNRMKTQMSMRSGLAVWLLPS